MKTRPHIVTQTRIYPTGDLERSALALAARMGTEGRPGLVLMYSRTLIRVMKIILDLTLRNNCFIRRRDVLACARLRKRVMQGLGGAPTLMKWRRQHVWNTARLAAIASGQYSAPGDVTPPARKCVRAEAVTAHAVPDASLNNAACSATLNEAPNAGALQPSNGPAHFRLPVLQNLNYRAGRGRSLTPRAKPQRRYPSIVLWPHELDGQYVPGFESRAKRPAAGGYASYGEPSMRDADMGLAGRGSTRRASPAEARPP